MPKVTPEPSADGALRLLREIAPTVSMVYAEIARLWSHGATLYVNGKDQSSAAGLFRVDPAQGSPLPLVTTVGRVLQGQPVPPALDRDAVAVGRRRGLLALDLAGLLARYFGRSVGKVPA